MLSRLRQLTLCFLEYLIAHKSLPYLVNNVIILLLYMKLLKFPINKKNLHYLPNPEQTYMILFHGA